jgi:hypothetical protein
MKIAAHPSNRFGPLIFAPTSVIANLTAKNHHCFSLDVALGLQKPSAKLLNDAFYAMLCSQIEKLRPSDPKVLKALNLLTS